MEDLAAAPDTRLYLDDSCHSASVGSALRLALNSLRQHVDRRLAPHGLTHAQWVPLFKIAKGEATNVVLLARDMAMDPGALTRALSRLEAKGLLRRVRSDADRRCVTLEVTEAGREVARLVSGVLTDVLNAHLVGFTRAEHAQLMAMLGRFITNGEALRQQEQQADDQEQEGTA